MRQEWEWIENWMFDWVIVELVLFEDGDLLRQHWNELKDIHIRLMRNTFQNEITLLGLPRNPTSTEPSNISTTTKKEHKKRKTNGSPCPWSSHWFLWVLPRIKGLLVIIELLSSNDRIELMLSILSEKEIILGIEHYERSYVLFKNMLLHRKGLHLNNNDEINENTKMTICDCCMCDLKK